MSETAPVAAAVVPAAPEVCVLLDPVAVLAAVADPVRHALVREVAKRGPMSVNGLAAKLGRAPAGISKHLRVLREARVLRVLAQPGADGRQQVHEIAAQFSGRDATGKPILDFGAVILRLE